MAHSHHTGRDLGDRKVLLAVLVNVLLTVAQVAGGVVAGSLALIADAIHNLSDAISLGIAFFARKIARRPADSVMSFGYGRAELVAALINYTTLIVIGLYLVYEAIWRFVEPQPVDGWLIVVVAGVALVVDLATAVLTFRLSRQSVNIRAAFLHKIADALGSVGVIVAGSVIILYQWELIDPLITLMIAGYILRQSFREGKGVIRTLMLGSPPEPKREDVRATLMEISAVKDVHHIHLWEIDEQRRSFDAHVVIGDDDWPEIEGIKCRIRQCLMDEYMIEHCTIEMERSIDQLCTNQKLRP